MTPAKKIYFSVLLFIGLAALSHIVSPRVEAAGCDSSTVRWASTSNTIYVTGPITCTLSEIKIARPTAPLEQVDPAGKVWLLKANLKLEGGATLNLHGSPSGGDTNQLRLKSNNSSATNSTIWIRAQWGKIDISSTNITSWDEPANGPDTEYTTYKRSYIHTRSYLEADGVTARESRMDIANSDIGYLGFNGSEAYGLTWKVLGTTPGIYDKVNVYGNVSGSRIHHNYFGAYTFGADGMKLQGNEIDSNIQYGLDPHDDSDNLVVENNKFHNNGNHGFICSQRCDNITVRNNDSYNNTGNGIMFHRNTNFSLIEGNRVNNNTDSGIAIFDSHNNTIRNNTSLRNKNGLRFSVGSSNNTVVQNDLGNNTSYGIYFYKGSDTPTSGDGHPKQNNFTGNNIHNNGNYPIKATQTDNNTFSENTFANNAKEIYLYASKENEFNKNTFTGNNNFYHARFSATATVKDTGQVATKIGDSASNIKLINTQNSIYQNNKNITTTATPDNTFITMTRAVSAGVVTFNKLNLSVKPSTGEVLVSPENNKKWSETSTNTSTSADHTAGNLSPDTTYTVLINNALYQTITSDPAGNIAFNYNGGYSGTKVFEVIESTVQGASIPNTFSIETELTPVEPESTPSGTPAPTVTPTPVEPEPTPTEPLKPTGPPLPDKTPESTPSGEINESVTFQSSAN
ncbi:hypothetical protein A3E45_00450 [Candidatus Daviesbacteria bacterium RIFCSPHIGHO2_12_FULL_43_11]|uniref:Right handed beta helix domain-containing protein n=1 Tax=Candidatus Daviesbacteria bacterium RIFCSPHIGHO2_12_FULL_43_11 TaxID=1797780 RepID=A0A1F5K449_9BACT|nr:MAG: hypothetical protein A3E45_00450 [Candidatus Daviesbacteria bacterium RIFCSPHIGHO2_12_FULL_43_11]